MGGRRKNCLSQFYYCIKAAELLKPLGILAIIVPASFLNDSFSDGAMISAMENAFSFLGQAALPENAFQDMGVAQFPVKLQFWQKRSQTMPDAHRYQMESMDLSDGFSAEQALQIYSEMIQPAQELLKENRAKILRELAQRRDTSEQFYIRFRKCSIRSRRIRGYGILTQAAWNMCAAFIRKHSRAIWIIRNGARNV